MSLPTVAIVGRPNVGKSSLFNRFLKRRLAVVDPTPGVTRDRNYAVCDWAGRSFRLIDTGGMVPQSKDAMEQLIHDQSEFAIHEADLVMFVVDTHTGSDTIDINLARVISRSGQNCLLVANKADSDTLAENTHDFLRLGLGDPIAVSATLGLGIGELLDELIALLPPTEEESADNSIIRVAVVGRPNVGKSSFINRLLGENRLIVSPIAGTTRDAVDSRITLGENEFILIDTAGLRRKYKVHENVEFYTTLRTERAIEACEVAIVMVDAADGVTAQDQRVLAKVFEQRRAAVLVINKWDTIEKDTHTADRFTASLRDILGGLAEPPVIYISALSGQRVEKVMELVVESHRRYHKEIPTTELNEMLQSILAKRKPPARKGKYIQMKYVTQTETTPPTFVFFTSHPQLVDKSYVSYLTNQLRAKFKFDGIPIRLKFRSK